MEIGEKTGDRLGLLSIFHSLLTTLMRWMWIDRIVELEKASRIVTVKNVSLAEEVLHDHFAATATRAAVPVLPNPLIVEGMAQTAGIMVGHARDFAEKVILAKISKAIFHEAAMPGQTLRFSAVMDRIDEAGAMTTGVVEVYDSHKGPETARKLADIELMFSHIDNNRSGLDFPEHNFVFTDQFMGLLERSGFGQSA